MNGVWILQMEVHEVKEICKKGPICVIYTSFHQHELKIRKTAKRHL